MSPAKINDTITFNIKLKKLNSKKNNKLYTHDKINIPIIPLILYAIGIALLEKYIMGKSINK